MMVRVTLFTSLLLVGAETLATGITVPASSDAVSLGSGYDSLTGEARNECITWDKTKKPVIQPIDPMPASITLIENQSKFEELKRYNINASFGNVAGNASKASDIAIDEYSVYFAVSMSVPKQKRSIWDAYRERPVLKMAMAKVLVEDPARFRIMCGDYFVITETKGGVLNALLQIKTKTHDEKRAIAAQVDADLLHGSGGAKAAEQVQSILKGRNVSVRILRGGAVKDEIALTPEKLTDAVRLFPQTITSQKLENLGLLAVTLMDYKAIADPHIDLSIFDNRLAETYLEAARTDQMRIREQIASMQYALENPDEFPPFDKSAVKEGVQQAVGALTKSRDAADRCIRTKTGCESYAATALSLPTLPDRHKGPTREELVARLAQAKTKWHEAFATGRIFTFCTGVGDTGGTVLCLNGLAKLRKWCEDNGCAP